MCGAWFRRRFSVPSTPWSSTREGRSRATRSAVRASAANRRRNGRSLRRNAGSSCVGAALLTVPVPRSQIVPCVRSALLPMLRWSPPRVGARRSAHRLSLPTLLRPTVPPLRRLQPRPSLRKLHRWGGQVGTLRFSCRSPLVPLRLTPSARLRATLRRPRRRSRSECNGTVSPQNFCSLQARRTSTTARGDCPFRDLVHREGWPYDSLASDIHDLGRRRDPVVRMEEGSWA